MKRGCTFVWLLQCFLALAWVRGVAPISVFVSAANGNNTQSCGKDTASPCQTVQYAVDLNTTVAGDTISLIGDDGSLYKETDVIISKSVTIEGTDSKAALWVCDYAGVERSDWRGAIRAMDGACISLENMHFKECYENVPLDMAGRVGGGVLVVSTCSGSVNITNCLFEDIASATLEAGHVSGGALLLEATQVSVSNSTFIRCQSHCDEHGLSASGGAISIVTSGDVWLRDVTFYQCRAVCLKGSTAFGGAYLVKSLKNTPLPVLALQRTIFIDNACIGTSSAGGAALMATSVSDSDLDDSLNRVSMSISDSFFLDNLSYAFSSNRSSASGAVVFAGPIKATVDRSVFKNNVVSAASCEGGALVGTALFSLAVTNCLFRENIASGNGIHQSDTTVSGGAVFVTTFEGVRITGCTFELNVVTSQVSSVMSPQRFMAYREGGAISVRPVLGSLQFSILRIESTVLSDNIVSSGGNKLQGGSDDFFSAQLSGGAIFCHVDVLEVLSCNFTRNMVRSPQYASTKNDGASESGVAGGAIFGENLNDVTVNGTLFHANAVLGGKGPDDGSKVGGGGVFFNSRSRLIRLVRCVFERNMAVGGGNIPALSGGTASGGGFLIDGAAVTIDDCTFFTNWAVGGPAEEIPGSATGPAGHIAQPNDVTVSNSVFAWNTGLGGLCVNNGNFLGCMPGSATAALSILTTGLFENTISLSNVTFDRNFAGNKGCDDGLFYGTLQGALSASGGTITIQSVKFLSNFLSPRGSRIGAGGGAWLTAHHVFLDGCIFQNNSVLGGESSFYSPGSQAAGGGMIGFATWEMSIVNTDFIDNIVVAGNSPIVYTAYASGAAGQPITLIKDKGAAYTAPIVRMGGYGYGGGLAAAELRSLNLLNVSFIGNSASGGTAHARGGLGLGGGLYVSNCEDLTVNGAQFTRNSAVGGDSVTVGGWASGGGAFMRLAKAVHLNNIVLQSNKMQGGFGETISGGTALGNMLLLNATSMTMNNCVFYNNSGTAGSSALGQGADVSSSALAIIGSEFTLTNIAVINNICTAGSGTRSGGYGIGVFVIAPSGREGTNSSMSHITVKHNTVVGGSSRYSIGGLVLGGLVHLQGRRALLRMEDCYFARNLASSGSGLSAFGWSKHATGGGLTLLRVNVLGREPASLDKHLIMTDCVFEYNMAVCHGTGSAFGGSLAVLSASAQLTNVSIRHSESRSYTRAYGGGAWFHRSSVYWTGGEMVGNKCSTGEFVSGSVVMRGGGLSIVEGFAEIVGISFASNCINSNDQRQLWWGSDHYWGEGFGGAFFFAEMSSVYIHRSSFFNNSATSGGAVYVALQSSDENQIIAFSHCDFLSNAALWYGGDVAFNAGLGNTSETHASITSCTMSLSSASRGGSIAVKPIKQFSLTINGTSVISGASANMGGAIFVDNDNNCRTRLNLSSVTFQDLFASLGGGVVGLMQALFPTTSDLCDPAAPCVISNVSAAYGNEAATMPSHLYIVHDEFVAVDDPYMNVSCQAQDSFGHNVTSPVLDNEILVVRLQVDGCGSTQVVQVLDQLGAASFIRVPLFSAAVAAENGSSCAIEVVLNPGSGANTVLSKAIFSVAITGCSSGILSSDGLSCEEDVGCDTTCIVMIVMSIVIFLLLCVIAMATGFIVFKRYKRWQRVKRALPHLNLGPDDRNPTLVEILRDPDIPVIPYDAIERGEIISSGAQGIVWRGRYFPSKDRKKFEAGVDVAIKQTMIKDCAPEKLQFFLKEVKITSVLDHPNICKFFGIVVTGENGIGMVSQFMENGSLASLMSKRGSLIPVEDRLELIIDVVEALDYLHEKCLVHGDLKPDNILINKKGEAVLADFGCSRAFIDGEDQWSQTLAGTPLYMAPELLEKKESNEKVDIYALGIIMKEVLTSTRAFDGMEDNFSLASWLQMVVADGFRPKLHGIESAGLRALISECWSEDHQIRPSSKELKERLRRLHYEISHSVVTEEEAVPLLDIQRSSAIAINYRD